jgi:hypothetical protein
LTEFGATGGQLFRRAIADFNRDPADEEQAFIHGDAHPYNMVVAPAAPEAILLLSAGVIDWEYARIGRGVSQDFAVASAYYALMEIAAAYRSELKTCMASADALRYICNFRYSLVSHYRAVSRQEGAKWAKGGAISGPSDSRAFIVRSAMIAHGTEIIRRAIALRRKCGHRKCMEGGDLEKSKAHCELMRRMIRHGVWYLHVSGADMLEFSDPENWKRLQRGHREGFWLFDLFL